MKIGLDVHKVIDTYPDIFREASKGWVSSGHIIHIITGQEWEKVGPEVDSFGITYHFHFSIVDYHRSIGTKMELRENGWWMDNDIWVRSKGDYIGREGIELHFDDSYEYAQYCPETCGFIHVRDDFRFIWNAIRL